jgi:ABC-type polysaccharide/polyol phosphate export permease
VTTVAAPSAPLAPTGAISRRQYLDLLVRWVRRDVRARYRRSALSSAWLLAQPLAATAIYCFIFGVIFDQAGGGLPYLSFFLAGMVVFRPVAAGLGLNTCLSDNHSLLSHSSFPRELVPLTQVLGASIDLVAMLPALIVVALVQGVTMHVQLLLAPLVVLGALCLGCGVCVVAATAQVFVRDVQFVILFGVQALFFATPISYDPEQLPASLRWIAVVNPIAVYAESLRDVALRGVWPDWPLLGIQLLVSVGLLVAAVAHLRAVGHRIVDLA